MGKRLSENDPNSYSNPEDCIVTDLDLNLEVDFKKHILSGYVDISIDRENPKADLILDTQDLIIKGVKNKNSNTKVNFTLDEPHEKFGSKLEIKLPKRATKKLAIRIEYETSPHSSALQWLEPEQTMGKKHPYMFSMCQAIHARSLIPCQDTPGVKAPYTATITAPYELTVLMSAVRNGEEMDEDPFMKKYKFVQKVPIPSYLFAIVIGCLDSRKIGPRSNVWAESEIVEKAAEDFSETEKLLLIAEELLGEYVWEVYDLLVLPPSFSYGGMENPCLTFVTPTLLTGDKSLALDTIAHEIIHSWIGNLVTNKNFEHFWLNEGFTKYFECKILGRLHGEPHRHFHCIGGWNDLEYTVMTEFNETHDFTKLVVDLTDFDPDESFSSVPYEKGSAFLFYLETLLGKPEFEKFLKSYIDEYKYKSIDTDTWKSYLYKYFSDKEDVLNTVDWNAWLYAPGMPPLKPDYDCSMVQKCIDLCKLWSEANDNELGQFSSKDIEEFSSYQICEFLAFLLKEEPLSSTKVEKMFEIYKLREQRNAEARLKWIRVGLVAQWKDIIPDAFEFINEQGRMKFVRPIYRDLYAWEETRERAIANYKEHAPEMMHATRQGIAKDIHVIMD
ncbi:hypothetical protein JTE90_018495 [Oedothorax gibbosus]|uniref:Leukotriene A(4) hydrolase n=1 Tax=Oedothorax gibbosus TaxID=931172 RepID=A0AAV6V239_9ARAC|nr:hypothetical protein JTE90_018495 [Oedothorax gibbosus]